MSDISNKTLAILVGIAIVVSLVGILSAPKFVPITGFADSNESSGTGYLDINATLQINVTVKDLYFGTGSVWSNSSAAFLNTTDGSYDNWTVKNSDGPGVRGNNLTVKNIGDLIANLSAYVNDTAATWVATGAAFYLYPTESVSTTCSAGATLASEIDLTTTPINAGTAVAICDGPQTEGFTTDGEIVAYGGLLVPQAVTRGTHTVTVTFLAYDNSGTT